MRELQYTIWGNRIMPIVRPDDPAPSHEAAADVTPKLSGKRAVFVQRLAAMELPNRKEWTAQEIADGDETIRKRAKECVILGAVVIAGARRCLVTGKNATTYRRVER